VLIKEKVTNRASGIHDLVEATAAVGLFIASRTRCFLPCRPKIANECERLELCAIAHIEVAEGLHYFSREHAIACGWDRGGFARVARNEPENEVALKYEIKDIHIKRSITNWYYICKLVGFTWKTICIATWARLKNNVAAASRESL